MKWLRDGLIKETLVISLFKKSCLRTKHKEESDTILITSFWRGNFDRGTIAWTNGVISALTGVAWDQAPQLCRKLARGKMGEQGVGGVGRHAFHAADPPWRPKMSIKLMSQMFLCVNAPWSQAIIGVCGPTCPTREETELNWKSFSLLALCHNLQRASQ